MQNKHTAKISNNNEASGESYHDDNADDINDLQE